MKKIVFSGVKPSGNFHLGNYLGAVKNWVKMQNEYSCIYSIMDLHAITVPQDPRELRNLTKEVLATYLACGINVNKSLLYRQSDISEHAELGWLLNCITPMGWAERMTQFKDKASKLNASNIMVGLFDYPILMAADILLYNTDLVPIGEDQKQHVELTRDIAGAFNRRYNVNYFKEPIPLIQGQTTRVMSLQDGTKKMSKSDESGLGCVYLLDDTDTIIKKVKKAKTDSDDFLSYDEDNRPEVANLLNIFSELSGESIGSLINIFDGKGFGVLKSELGELLVEKIIPIGNEINKLKQDELYLTSILEDGKEKAKVIAEKNLKEIKNIMGF